MESHLHAAACVNTACLMVCKQKNEYKLIKKKKKKSTCGIQYPVRKNFVMFTTREKKKEKKKSGVCTTYC